jgi:transposase
MGRGLAVRNERRGRTATAMMAAVSQRTTVPPYQTRMCARCGYSTTFVLEDPVGGWYMCVECGHFA